VKGLNPLRVLSRVVLYATLLVFLWLVFQKEKDVSHNSNVVHVIKRDLSIAELPFQVPPPKKTNKLEKSAPPDSNLDKDGNEVGEWDWAIDQGLMIHRKYWDAGRSKLYSETSYKPDIKLKRERASGQGIRIVEEGATREQGIMIVDESEMQGKPHGLEKIYYETGQLKSETPFKDGMKQGLVKIYFISGVLESTTPYLNNVVHGMSMEYYESGQVRSETPYMDGKIEGNTRTYHEEGWLQFDIELRAGTKHGWYKEFNHSRVVIWKKKYALGKPIG